MADKKRLYNSKWDDSYYLLCYRLAEAGTSERNIAQIIGIDHLTLMLWKKDRPALREALNEGRTKGCTGKGKHQFRDYVYERLPSNIKELWDKIDSVAPGGDAPSDVIQTHLAMSENGTRMRQHLYIYALVHSCFSEYEAMKRVGVSNNARLNWMERDPEFIELIDEIHEAKRDYFESHLLDLVARGDARAILFVNKTYNRPRGYGDWKPSKSPVKGKKSRKWIKNNQEGFYDVISGVPVSELDLPQTIKDKIKGALLRWRTNNAVQKIAPVDVKKSTNRG